MTPCWTVALNELRENWINPPESVDWVPEIVTGDSDRLMPKNDAAEKELKKRTLTNLYDANPVWLQHTHRALDEVFAAAHGWKAPLSAGEILKRLFELNQERAGPALQ